MTRDHPKKGHDPINRTMCEWMPSPLVRYALQSNKHTYQSHYYSAAWDRL